MGSDAVAATPAELRTYVSRTRGAREEVEEARRRLHSAIARLQRELPSGYGLPTPPAIAGLLTRLSAIDDHVGVVADRFEQAGAAMGDGRFRLDEAAIWAIPFESRYSQEQRRRLQQQVEEELATLRERIRSGDTDETTAGELVATLDLMRHLVETAGDPQGAAAALIETMGPLDLHEALSLLEDAARDIDHLDARARPIRGIDNLALVVGLGLEDQPRRAQRWADTLFDERDLPHGLDDLSDLSDVHAGSQAVEGPALLAAAIPAEAQRFTLSLFDRLVDAGPAPRDGLLEQLHGTTAPTEPVLRNASKAPTLANGIVHLLLDDTEVVDSGGNRRLSRFDVVFGRASAGIPGLERDVRFTDIPESLLGDVLIASVDPSLDTITRGTTAQALTSHYVAVEEAGQNYAFSDEVTRGFATATQPLLESWSPRQNGVLVLASEPQELLSDDSTLWKAVGLYGTNPGGVDGLGDALTNATAVHIRDAYDKGISNRIRAGDTYPFEAGALTTLENMHNLFEANVSGQRFSDVVAELESGNTGQSGVHAFHGLVGELSGGSTASGLVDAISEGSGREVTGGGNALVRLTESVTAQLIDLNLISNPELATTEVLNAIRESRETGDGVYSLMTESDIYPRGSKELDKLSVLVVRQLQVIEPFNPEASGESTSDTD